ncbi:MAG: tetratricopeptide repeat protein [Betaproteobacteria bacterium]|nr:tetratricopeptide repeat protein [Betaproteobacteria bacterium]
MHFDEGRLPPALAGVDACIARRGPEQAALVLRAAILAAWGRCHEAVATLGRVPGEASLPADEALQAAQVRFRCGDFEAAERLARTALRSIESVPALACLAASLHAQDRLEDAAAAYRQVLQLQPAAVDGLVGLGNCLMDMGSLEDAEALFRSAAAADPDNVDAWSFLATALDRQDREAEAIAAFERAVAVHARAGADGDVRFGLAASLATAGRLAEAIALFEAFLPAHPSAKAYLFYSHTLLLAGRLPEGWWFNEFRWMTGQFVDRKPSFGRPAWTGQDLRGRTILIHVEQGLGDSIQFVRYVPRVKALGATVLLVVRPELERLLTGFPGVDRLLVAGDTVTLACDYVVHLLSLPEVFRTALDSVPADVPYLEAPEDARAQWRERLAGAPGLRVGLVWAGNPDHPGDRSRSIALDALAPLGAVPGVRYFSLQKGERAAQARTPPPGLDLVDLSAAIGNFTDTAAIIANLDLVVCVDTAVAHLAGALGKDVWMLISQPPDWRWLLGRADTPWYPTMRLFRQAVRGRWDEAIAEVAAALRARAECGRAEATIVVPARPAPVSVPMPPPVCLPPAGVRPGHSAVRETRHGTLMFQPDAGDAGRAMLWYGEWLQSQLDLVLRLLRPGATVVEVDAGVGMHAVRVAATVGPQGHLIAVEADPVRRAILRENMKTHRHRHVTILGAFSGARDAGPAGRADASGLGCLDDLQLERLDCLKVNGATAAEVLRGAHETAWRLRPLVCVCAVDAGDRARALPALQALGYRCWAVEGPLFNPHNFAGRSEDVFAGRSSFAIVAIPEEQDVPVVPADWSEADAPDAGGTPP